MSANASETFGFPLSSQSRVSRSAVVAGVSSFVVHVVLLAALGLVTFASKLEVFTTLSSIVEDQELNLLDEKYDAEPTENIGNQGDFSTFTTTQEVSTSVANVPRIETDRTIVANVAVPRPVFDELPQPSKADVLAPVATTGTTEHAGGVTGAIDRLAQEIADSLREKKALVIWLFDVSPSLSARRESIAERVENVYNQLNQLNIGADKALKSAVATFDDDCTIVTSKPIDDASELVGIVRRIKSESSGDENTFAAILKVANHFKPFRTEQHRDVMIVVVTDEEGSDADNLERSIELCKRYGMRCYCVGDSAPFGRRNVETPFVLESGEQVVGVMQKGPESRYAELLRLGYWGTHSHDLDDMAAGFGPYGLTRLCSETNGLYLVADNGRGHHNFDPAVMRNYAPDYRPIHALERDVRSNKAKLALMESCALVEKEAQNRKVTTISMPRLEFRAENDTVLRRELTEGQKPIADLDASLDQLLRRLEVGEKDRAKVKEARWRASYDLAIGRTLALRARAFGYNSMLAEMKVNPKSFERADNNLWRLVPSKNIGGGISVKKIAQRADEYLGRVIEEHPGTPWALMAEREKNVPMGWDWREGHYNAEPKVAAGTPKNRPKFIDNEKPKQNDTPKPVKVEPQRRNI